MNIFLFSFCFISSVGISISQNWENFSISAEITPSCKVKNNGLIKLLIKNGVPPCVIYWNEGVPYIQRIALSAGKYNANVTDKLGWISKVSLIVDNYSSFSLEIDQTYQGVYTDVELRISGGGQQPFSVMWINAGGRLKTISRSMINAMSGNYITIVTDGNVCSEINKFSVE